MLKVLCKKNYASKISSSWYITKTRVFMGFASLSLRCSDQAQRPRCFDRRRQDEQLNNMWSQLVHGLLAQGWDEQRTNFDEIIVVPMHGWEVVCNRMLKHRSPFEKIIMEIRNHICHGYQGLYLWRKFCHVEKFQISVKNWNNLWRFIEIYVVFVLNLCGKKFWGGTGPGREKMLGVGRGNG